MSIGVEGSLGPIGGYGTLEFEQYKNSKLRELMKQPGAAELDIRKLTDDFHGAKTRDDVDKMVKLYKNKASKLNEFGNAPVLKSKLQEFKNAIINAETSAEVDEIGNRFQRFIAPRPVDQKIQQLLSNIKEPPPSPSVEEIGEIFNRFAKTFPAVPQEKFEQLQKDILSIISRGEQDSAPGQETQRKE
jgi:hypothetical protein